MDCREASIWIAMMPVTVTSSGRLNSVIPGLLINCMRRWGIECGQSATASLPSAAHVSPALTPSFVHTALDRPDQLPQLRAASVRCKDHPPVPSYHHPSSPHPSRAQPSTTLPCCPITRAYKTGGWEFSWEAPMALPQGPASNQPPAIVPALSGARVQTRV